MCEGVDCVSTFSVFRFFSIGCGVDVRNESVIKIDNIDDPYKYINEQVKASVPSLLSIPGPDPSFNCFESPPDIICIRFNCLLSVDRVTYVDACFSLAAYISCSSAPSITRVLAYASARAFIYIYA